MKDYRHYTIVASVVVVVLIAGAFWAGFSYGKSQIPSEYLVEGISNKNFGQPDDVDFSLFWDAWQVVEERYAGREDLNFQEMVYGAISGMVESLGDPYTVFLPPQESKIFREDVSGSFEGIGAEIGIRNEILTVISPLEGSPAKRAGLEAGDRIFEIDDNSTEGFSINEAVQKIRGPKGTVVVLSVFRDGETKEIPITRDTISVPALELEIVDDSIAHVRVFNFSQDAPDRFREAMRQVSARSINKVVLDLRNNPGGFLEVAQSLMGWFVDPGEIIAIEDFGDSRPDREYRAIGNGSLRVADVVVLINGGSASASEIMAGALRDIRGIKLVGTKSFGKGSIQELEILPKGSSLKVTVARWLTPSGISISEQGLDPDFVVEVGEDTEPGQDPQLERALEILGQE